MTEIRWKRIELTLDLFRCDLCGEQADTIHWVGQHDFMDALCAWRDDLRARGEHENADPRWFPVPDPNPIRCAFACPRHDAGGYHLDLEGWLAPDSTSPDHVFEKVWGMGAAYSYDARVEVILRDAAERDRVGAQA